MPIKEIVRKEIHCDLCNRAKQIKGEPPEGWQSIQVGSGIVDGVFIDRCICPACMEVIIREAGLCHIPEGEFENLEKHRDELGITRQDIEAWTKQAVATEVEKFVGQINVDSEVSRAVRRAVTDSIQRSTWSQGAAGSIHNELGRILSRRVRISVINPPDPGESQEENSERGNSGG
jgi:hypothetical protein